ncbi:MAG TPA: hypothetical protein VG895_05300 [Patescibacteria group bacterium]|nr:hypothetical protein [Patescibacteria group bacterium]
MSPSINDFLESETIKPKKGTQFVFSKEGAERINKESRLFNFKEGDKLTYPALSNNDGNHIYRYLQMHHERTGGSLPIYRDQDLFAKMLPFSKER